MSVKDVIVEIICREQQHELNSNATERDLLEAKYGKVWNTQELQQDFEVLQFMAPYVVVKRKDGKMGSLQFQHMPRYYFNWCEDTY